MRRLVTPDQMDAGPARDLGQHAAAHGWHAAGFVDPSGSDTPGRVDETLELVAPDRELEVWLFCHDVNAAGVPAWVAWRAKRGGLVDPFVEDLQLLRRIIRDLGVIDLRTVA